MFSMWVCMRVWPVSLGVYCLWCWWLWLCSLVHSAAWCWTPPLLHCFPCHELVFSVFPGCGLSPWHETKGSHSQGPQATQVCTSSPHSLLFTVSLSQWSALWFPLHFWIIYVMLFNKCLTLVRLSDAMRKKYASVFLSNLCGLQNFGSKIWLRSLHLNIWSSAAWGLSIKTKQDVCLVLLILFRVSQLWRWELVAMPDLLESHWSLLWGELWNNFWTFWIKKLIYLHSCLLSIM